MKKKHAFSSFMERSAGECNEPQLKPVWRINLTLKRLRPVPLGHSPSSGALWLKPPTQDMFAVELVERERKNCYLRKAFQKGWRKICEKY